ncbi:MAG: inorganic pyrophosphatase Ppa, partial [Spirochaetes bacterium]|nr:inorganic pyrophosphatase Ppa [Spirochaetota bacterium]
YAVNLRSKINFSEQHRIFEGTPQKDPNDPSKIILIVDPFSENESFYEFAVNSIAHIEEIGTISDNEGKNAIQVKLWIKKGTLAVESKPFIV